METAFFIEGEKSAQKKEDARYVHPLLKRKFICQRRIRPCWQQHERFLHLAYPE